jgi:hypothetical protein
MNGPRLLHIYHDGMGSSMFRVMDTDKKTCLYMVRQKRMPLSSGADIEIVRTVYDQKSGLAQIPVGTVDRHTFSRSLDTTIRNRPVALNSNGMFSGGGYSYTSPRSKGAVLTWDKEGMFSDSWVLGGQSRAAGGQFARVETVKWSTSKVGRLEVWQNTGDDELLDEVVVTGLAVLLEARRRRKRGNNTAAAAGSI